MLQFVTIAIVLSNVCTPGLSLYFPQEKLEVGVATDLTPIILRAVLDPDDQGTVSYTVGPPTPGCPTVETVQDQESGESVIYYKCPAPSNDKTRPWTCVYLVTASLEGQVGGRNQIQAYINLTVYGPMECSNDLRCWRGATEYKLQVMENSQQVKSVGLGYTLPSPCDAVSISRSEVTYDLKMAGTEDAVFIGEGIHSESRNAIIIRASLDREFQEKYWFNVTCTIKEVREGLAQLTMLTIPGTLSVLDQNDNGPLTQEGSNLTNVSISLKHMHNKYEPHQRLIQYDPKDLLFRDWDTVGTNNFELMVHNDWKGLLNLTFVISRIPGGANKSQYTVIRPTISLSSSIHDIEPWPGVYCIDASFTDISIISVLRNQSTMDYRICTHWMHENSTLLRESIESGIWNRDSNSSRPPETETVPYSSVLTSGTLDGAVCNNACMMLVTGVGCFFLVVLVTMIILVSNRVSHKKKRRGGVGLNLLSGGAVEGNGDHSGMSMTILGSEMDYMGSDRFGTSRRHPETEFMIDSKWEIPRKALILENSIGTGQFGHVYKGRTDAIRGKEGTFFEVAMKMLKDNYVETGKSCRQEFLSEFSLLQQLDHPNVIKVLGVCTTPGGPLYLVMEYAEFGSLRGFLRKCRRVETLENGINNVETEFSGSTVPGTPNPVEQQDFVVSPREILQFSWQIAKGMTYLSDMKMVHRDLAARNILLTKSKLCKISDFGLTRDIYVDEAYQKKSRGPVPVKWLAPESLADEVYTKKSDVWSYGILLWELATLGASPYPGIPAEELYAILKSGYRMPPPPNTSAQFYTIMRQCWAHEPWNRPTFRSIEMVVGKLLEEGIEYLKMDLPIVSNPGYDWYSANPNAQTHCPLTYASQPTPAPMNTFGIHTYINSAHEPLDYPTLDSVYEIPIGLPNNSPAILQN